MGQVQVSWVSQDSWIPTVALVSNSPPPLDPFDLPHTIDRPLPEDPFDPEVLVTFKCPFQQEVTSPPYYCSLKSICPFGHSTTGALRPLPKCFCVERLLNRCESTSLERLNPGDLVRCEFGFHPDAQDLIELERFKRRVADAILGKPTVDTKQTVKQNTECVICLKPIPTMWSPNNGCGLNGFLENCTHRFCGKCILDWRTRNQAHPLSIGFTCPTCRAPSSRIMFWPEPVCSLTRQAHLFRTQKARFGIHVNARTLFLIKETQGNDVVEQFEMMYQGYGYRVIRNPEH